MKNPLLMNRLYFTAIVTIAIWALLLWNHFHGGVPGHHILARKDMPEISNWWGGLLLPLLTWFLVYFAQNRSRDKTHEILPGSGFLKPMVYGFTLALFFGLLLSAFFMLGYSDLPGYMLLALLLLALFFPIYRPECILGFVIGMTSTFGAVLPAIAGSVFALTGLVIYLYLRPVLLFIMNRALGSNKATR